MVAREQHMGFLLKHAYARFQEIQQESLSPLGLTGRMIGVLAAAAELAPTTQQRIGERLRVDRTTMVALIDNLETSGLVERRIDPNDRRSKLVHITPKGQKALADGLEASKHAEAAFLAPLTHAERETYRTMTARLG
jgi:DNA-binding MarR family transcriptional regulator